MDNTIYFYGHNDENNPYSCFSNFFPIPFEFDHHMYHCSEQAMMHRKALLMGDAATADKIMKERTPGGCKRLGRQIKPWDEHKWMSNREEIVYEILLAKFGQHPHLWKILSGTKDATIAEAAPKDRIWGIGLSVEEAKKGNPWQGMNLLGKCLQRVRHYLFVHDSQVGNHIAHT